MKYTFLTIGIVIVLLVGALFVWQKSNTSTPTPIPSPTPIIPPPTTTPSPVSPTPPPVAPYQTPTGWTTYTNSDLGFSLKYPSQWFVYDQAKWEQDNKNGGCKDAIGVSAQNVIILNSKDLGKCVGTSRPAEGQDGDFVVYVYKTKWPDSPVDLPEDPKSIKTITIDGVKALGSYFTKESPLPRNRTIDIYLNHKDRAYLIEFTQEDFQGNYSPTFHKILESFSFLIK